MGSAAVARYYATIPDRYGHIDEVIHAIKAVGESEFALIVGVDFSKSNLEAGESAYDGHSLHDTHKRRHGENPYEEAIKIIAKALSDFDADKLFPVYGFGDAHTGDKFVFAFEMDEPPRDVGGTNLLLRPPREMACDGLEAALERYREIVPEVTFAGPTSFAPIIRQAIFKIREASVDANQKPIFHILLIITDGQIAQSCKIDTEKAIAEASLYPLSIICVGVGDGPWNSMEKYDNRRIRGRLFDNFQFVDFNTVFAKYPYIKRKEAFATHALQPVPTQVRACRMFGSMRKEWEMPRDFKRPPLPLGPPDMLRFAPEEDPSYAVYASVNPSYGVVDGWTAVHHHRHNTYFYMNKETGESLWDKPVMSIYKPPPPRKVIDEDEFLPPK